MAQRCSGFLLQVLFLAEQHGPPVAFMLSGYYRLTSVNVVLAADIATNKYAHPIWSLVTESNSVPTASFV